MKFGILSIVAIPSLALSQANEQPVNHQDALAFQSHQRDQRLFSAIFDGPRNIIMTPTTASMIRECWAGDTKKYDFACRKVPEPKDYEYIENGGWVDVAGQRACQHDRNNDNSQRENRPDNNRYRACYVRREFIPRLERQLGKALPEAIGGVVSVPRNEFILICNTDWNA